MTQYISVANIWYSVCEFTRHEPGPIQHKDVL